MSSSPSSSSRPLDPIMSSTQAPGDRDHDHNNDNDPNPTPSSSYALLQLSSLASLNNLVELNNNNNTDGSSNHLGTGGSLPPIPVLGGVGQSGVKTGQARRTRGSSPPQQQLSRSPDLASTSLTVGTGSKRKRTNGKESTRGKDKPNGHVDGLWLGVDPSLTTDVGTREQVDMDGQGKKRRVDDTSTTTTTLDAQDRLGRPGGYPDPSHGSTGLVLDRGQDQGASRGAAGSLGMEVTMDQAVRNAVVGIGEGGMISGGEEGGESSGDKKSKRAEQNRKAQQAFRRRREEKIKELECKAKEMERLNRAIEDGLTRVGEVELANEALRVENRMLRSVVMMLASRRSMGTDELTALTTFLDDQGDFILPPQAEEEELIGLNPDEQPSSSSSAAVVMPGLDLATATTATAVDEHTAEEVVRNLLNVSNELTGVTLAVMEGTAGGSGSGGAGGTGGEGVDQTVGSEDKIKLALDRLRDKSRVVAQALDIQRRQARDSDLSQPLPGHNQAEMHHPVDQDAVSRHADPSVTMIVSVDSHREVLQGESAWKSLAQLEVLDRIIAGGSNWSTHPAQLNTVIADEPTLRLLPEQVNKLRREIAVIPGEPESWSMDGLTATVSDLERAVSSLRQPVTSKTFYLCSSSRQYQDAMMKGFVNRVLLVRSSATMAGDQVDGEVLQDLKEPEWKQVGYAEMSDFVGSYVGSTDEDGQRGQYEMWVRQQR